MAKNEPTLLNARTGLLTPPGITLRPSGADATRAARAALAAPVRGSRGVPGNFTFDEALALCREAGIPRLLGHHFGMFEFNDVDPLELAKRQDAAVATCFPRVDEVCFCRRDHGSIGMQP